MCLCLRKYVYVLRIEDVHAHLYRYLIVFVNAHLFELIHNYHLCSHIHIRIHIHRHVRIHIHVHIHRHIHIHIHVLMCIHACSCFSICTSSCIHIHFNTYIRIMYMSRHRCQEALVLGITSSPLLSSTDCGHGLKMSPQRSKDLISKVCGCKICALDSLWHHTAQRGRTDGL